jgi:glycosyltransferase involved in cell wall biosynthesis
MNNNKQPIRVLHIARMKKGSGVASVLMNYYRNIDRSKVLFDFLSDGNEWETFESEINSLGGKLYKVPNYKRHFLRFILLVYKIMKSKMYSIIHTHELAYNLPILIIARIKGISHSHSHSHIQDGDFFSRVKKFFISTTRPLYGFFASKRFACTKNAGKFLYGKLQFEIIPNAIQVEKFLFSSENRDKIRTELFLSDDVVLIGYVAGFSIQKNHSFLIEVLELLVKEHKNIRLILVGYGAEMENIKNLVFVKQLSDFVIFYGKSDNVEELYSAMDVFAFPSLGEGLGIVGIEAQTNGLPVLASTNIPPEMKISDLVYWLDLKEGAKIWADKLLEITGKRKMTDMSKTITEAGYNISEEAKKLTDLYCGLSVKTDTD